jgi:hypothetical protein
MNIKTIKTCQGNYCSVLKMLNYSMHFSCACTGSEGVIYSKQPIYNS